MNEKRRKETIMTTKTMTPTADAALARVLALRKVTFETNTQTRRSQGTILQSLTDDDLIAVSLALTEHQAKYGW
jgi:hypothetical protein